MLTTFLATIGCTLFLSGLAQPTLAQTGCREDPEHTSGTTPAPEVLGDGPHLFVTGADDRAPTIVFQAPGRGTGWGKVPSSEVSGGTDLTAALLVDQLSRVVTDVTDHIDVKVRREPSA